MIFFKIDWFDILAVQGTLKSLLETCPALTSIHDTGKIIVLTTSTFISKMMSLLFNILTRFVIAFLPGSNHFLIP